MNRLQIVQVTKIKVGFSWVDWGLCDEPGVVLAAQALNEALESAVNNGCDRMDTMHSMNQMMLLHHHYGAMGLEPTEHLHRVLDEIYGEPD